MKPLGKKSPQAVNPTVSRETSQIEHSSEIEEPSTVILTEAEKAARIFRGSTSLGKPLWLCYGR